MATLGEGFFCVHRKVRTTCPECRPPPPPPRPKAERAAKTSAPRRKADPDARPRPKRVKPPTRVEAENAQAWWVKK